MYTVKWKSVFEFTMNSQIEFQEKKKKYEIPFGGVKYLNTKIVFPGIMNT